jgi:hypothetical protein
MFIVSPAAKDTGPALVQLVAVEAIGQLRAVAAPFFITVTVSVDVAPPDCAVPDRTYDRLDTLEAAVNVYVFALAVELSLAELLGLPNRQVVEEHDDPKEEPGNTVVPLLPPESTP